MNRRRRIWLGRVAVAVAAYAVLTVLAHIYAEQSLYYPRYGSFREPEGMKKLRAGDGSELAVLYLPNPAAKLTIWYFHGNAEDLGDIEATMKKLRAAGFAIFACEYPGYGLSSGHHTEDEIYAASRVARDYLQNTLKVPMEKVMLYGRSLGGGPAVQMATEAPVAGLVLQSAFTSAYRVLTHWSLLPFDEFDNLKKISRITCPVLVMHGRFDAVIPPYHSEALLAAAPGLKRSLWVDRAGHNNLPEVAGAAYWQALQDFAGVCANPPTQTKD